MTMLENEILPGIVLRAVETSKFKTSMLSISFIEELSKTHGAENALVPALLNRGSKKYPDMISRAAKLDDMYGAAVEPVVRKLGSSQCVGFLASFLDDAYIPGESNMLKEAIEFMGELLLNPAGDGKSFLPQYVESEKENLLQKIRGKINDKQQYAMHRLISQMFSGESYGVDKNGGEEELLSVTGESLWKRYETLLETAPMYIYYAGSAKGETVEALIKEVFSALPQGKRKAFVPIEETGMEKQESVRYFEDAMDVGQGKLTMGFRLPYGCDSLEKIATLRVFNTIYGSSTKAKLFLNVRERLSLCYYASTMADRMKSVVLLSSGIAFEDYERAKDEILAQLDDCRKAVIAEEELSGAKLVIKNQLCTTLDAQGRLEEYWLGQMVSGTKDTAEDLSQAVEKVTIEAVQKLANDLWLDSIYFLRGKESAGC